MINNLVRIYNFGELLKERCENYERYCMVWHEW